MQLDAYLSFALAALVLLLGRWLVAAVPLLGKYSVPGPVVGGLLVAVAALVVRIGFDLQIRFDTAVQTPLMLTFFACIGLNAEFASLRRGGRDLLRFLVVVSGLLFLQNAVGIALASAFGLSPLVGLLGGSISLSGGHGTGAAWASVFSARHGLAGALEVAMACATFGLVLGGLTGGPVAHWLIRRHNVPVPADAAAQAAQEPQSFEEPGAVRRITAPDMAETLALIAVCLTSGQFLARAFAGTALDLPPFVWVLFTGLVLRNGLAVLGWYTIFERPASVLGNVSLALFLSMALMSLDLWALRALALPIVALLAVQTAAMAAYAMLVTYRFMGRNYDASVLAAGHCGFGLGATPTAITNMQAVTNQFGPAHRAFLLVPIVGAFFMDAVNAITIKLFLLLPFMR